LLAKLVRQKSRAALQHSCSQSDSIGVNARNVAAQLQVQQLAAGNAVTDRMVMLGVHRKEKHCIGVRTKKNSAAAEGCGRMTNKPMVNPKDVRRRPFNRNGNT